MQSRLLVFLLLCVVTAVRCSEDEEGLDADEAAVRRWQHTFATLKRVLGSGIKAVMPHLMSTMSDGGLNITTECRRALFVWIADLRSIKPWALKMADASAKMIDGALTGTFASYGSFDQCVDIYEAKKNIRGQYCSVQMWPKVPPKPRFYALNQRLKAFKRFENNTEAIGEFTKYIQLFYMFPFRLGVCIPSACTAQELAKLVKLGTQSFGFNVTVPRCDLREEVHIETYQIPFLCVVAILTLMVVIGTVYDHYILKMLSKEEMENLGVLKECIVSFSAVRNWKTLFNLETGEKNLRVLHGIRFFSMCWVILGHTYFHLNFNILRHLQITIELTSQFIFNTVTNASLVVDNFFFLGGLLFTYITMDMMKVMGKTPRALYFIVHRLWRFLPIQMFFVGCSTLLPLLGDGPVWHENIDPIVEGCKRDWWANFIFINNIYRSTYEGCLSYSWYLAADFQIYVFCIPIVILTIRKPKWGIFVNLVLIVLSIVVIGVHTYVRDLPPSMLFTRADVEQRSQLMRETYYTPYQHLSPFCIGILVGYYLHERRKPLQMHWSMHALAWFGTFALTSTVLFGVHPWNSGYGETGIVVTVLYASLSRTAWTLGQAWITVSCTLGFGGLIGEVLRANVFIPFSRLTFLVYMVHPLVQHVFYATLRDGIQALNHLAVFICFGYIVSSYGIALILSLILESPFINLGKMVFRRRESSKKRKRSLPPNICRKPALGNGTCNGAFDVCENTRPSHDIVVNGEDFVCRL